MKINTQRDVFLNKINIASHFTSNKLSSTAILQGILCKEEKDELHIYSTNLKTYYHSKIKVPVEKNTEFVIEPRKIIEFLNFLEPRELIIEIKEKQIVFSQGKTKGAFPLMSASDFPLPPKIQEKEEKINSKLLLKNLPLVLFAASADETRPILTGVNFVNSGESMIIVATDGFRLSLLKEKGGVSIPSMIIPSDFIDELLRYAKDSKEIRMSFSREEKITLFTVEDDEFYSRLIEGEFPPFERVIPTEVKTKIVADRSELLRNTKLISVFARDFSSVVVCKFSKNTLSMRPKKEASEENTAEQEVEMEGDEQQVAMNYKFLLDFLNHADCKKVTIEILRSDAPLVLRTDNNPQFLHIIMPVRIQE
ncbi:MAG: DNA polymerase III subunit beta [bacterium]|nr:DNA polymerase III subunit beta [bacterium]